ncbi:Aste57867_17621 [Aphanomyces stellatus]|uniref:Aste57867_17621 protein n=1 Tax=Aphanomyces stellatus TaxID=120398 RepID=A0A485L913_9STRA|nr:hypothetical protein As57867_017561 [Aphanomyces stellatus]VFT94372.1 Aste57867_17621 [Aphanomyces stellatus]
MEPTSPPPPTTTDSICFFNDCSNPVLPNSWKCHFHRHRGRCHVDDCRNQVYARHLCGRHGGKKQCKVEGCTLNARLGSVCCKHGAGSLRKLCSHPNCTKQVHARDRCVRHGGGRQCRKDGCKNHARSGGYCRRHGHLRLLVRPPSPNSSLMGPNWDEPTAFVKHDEDGSLADQLDSIHLLDGHESAIVDADVLDLLVSM